MAPGRDGSGAAGPGATDGTLRGASDGPGAATADPAAGRDEAVGAPVASGVPAPRTGQPVDLDLPFTLDQGTMAGPAPSRPPAGAVTASAATASPPQPDPPGTPDRAVPDNPTDDPQPDSPSPASGPAPAGRGTESPWAQPPQRSGAVESSNGPAEPASASNGPVPGSPGPASPAAPTPAPAPAPAPAPVHGTIAATQHGPTVPRQSTALPPESVPQLAGGVAAAPGGAMGAEPPPAMPQPGMPQPATGEPPDPDAPPGPGTDATAGPRQDAPPPGPFPPQPGWYPPGWQQGPPQTGPAPRQPYRPADGVTRVPPAQPDPDWSPETTAPPTAEDFARRRQVRPADPVATLGVRAVFNKVGLRLPPGRHELELKRDIEMVRRNFGGLRQVTVVNPKGGAGKTVAILLLAMTFGQKRGGYVLAWDNNETQGTLGMRAQQDFHARTVRDLLRDLGQFQGAHGRIGDLSQYVRSQGEGMFDVLASDESATGGEMLTAAAFAEIREVVSRFYKLIFVDTGNNVRAQNWQAAMDATDQLVVTMSARNDSAETAARMLDHLEQSGRQRLVRQAVSVVSMPPSRKEIDLPAIQQHFAARTRAVLLAPYERLIDTGEPIRYGALSAATRDAWLKIAAAVAEGL
uniref:MinD/ParA family ATP-binding protein n=1 Tax=Micromonospora sp. S4605 TaxID=1420897 RepID=UPI001E58CE43|nr:chromosome partitioning protein [Micromonospora sp. S4605]